MGVRKVICGRLVLVEMRVIYEESSDDRGTTQNESVAVLVTVT